MKGPARPSWHDRCAATESGAGAVDEGVEHPGRRSLMPAVILTVFAVVCGASGVLGADGALPPGKPAGIKTAQIVRDPAFYIVFGLGLIGTGIAIAASSHGTTATSTTATSSTATSP